MRKILTAIILLGCTMMLHAAKANKKVKITVAGESREYWLYVPNYSLTEEEVTGIGAQVVNRPLSNGKWTDLQGRRVSNPQHGLYIKGGQKMYVK